MNTDEFRNDTVAQHGTIMASPPADALDVLQRVVDEWRQDEDKRDMLTVIGEAEAVLARGKQ